MFITHNNIQHEKLGVPGNFCGPDYLHKIRGLEQRVKELEAELSKFIQAVGLASTLVPNMIIDVSDPIGMMQTVTNELSTLSAELHRARTDSRYWDEFNTISKHDAIRAENEQLRAEIKSRVAAKVAEFRAEVEGEMARLRAGIEAVEGLINDSQGVYGLHLNGDCAPWETLRTGGQFEDWLIDFDKALGGGA
jgi:hypothetical protein